MRCHLNAAGTTSSALAALLVLCTASPAPTQESPALTISAQARALEPGEVVALEVACRCAPPASATAKAFGVEIPLVPLPGDAGWSGLVGIDVDVSPGDYPVTVMVERPQGPSLTGTYTLRVTARQFRTRQLRVAPKYVDPPPAILKRIQAEADRLNAIFSRRTPRERVGPFQQPIDAIAGDTFGARSVFNGQARSPHGGVDFSSPTGTPVVAPAPAVVALAGDLYFTGGTVILDHGRGLYSVLAHLSTITVAQGDAVEGGDAIGAVGATGRVTGPHLHWGTRLLLTRVDPMSLIEVLPAER